MSSESEIREKEKILRKKELELLLVQLKKKQELVQLEKELVQLEKELLLVQLLKNCIYFRCDLKKKKNWSWRNKSTQIKNTQKFLKIQIFKTRSKRSFWNRGLLQILKLMISSERTCISLYSKKSSMISKATKT